MKLIKYAFALALLASPVAAQDAIEGKALRAIDGDTFIMETASGEIAIRLWAVDAPELSDWPWGPRSKFTLEALLARGGLKVRCERKGKSHERTVAQCLTSDGRDLGAMMIRAGNAIEYHRFGKGVYRNDEKQAQQERSGIWRDFPSPFLPRTDEENRFGIFKPAPGASPYLPTR